MSGSRPKFGLNQVPGEELAEFARDGQDEQYMSLRVVDDVLAGTQACFQQQGVPDEIMAKLKELWIAKIRQLNPDHLSSELMAAHDEDVGGAASSEGSEVDPDEIVIACASRGLAPAATAAQPLVPEAGPAPVRTASTKKRIKRRKLTQFDGPHDTSDDEDDIDKDDDDDDDDGDDDDDDDDDDDILNDEDENEDGGPEEEPLGSGDDISDEDPSDLFDTENVVVCQYDKITRARNKWKFHLKDGIMNLNGRDYVFQRATGDAEW